MSSPKSQFTSAIVWLIPACCLVAVSVYLGLHFPLPTAGARVYGAGQYNSALYWQIETLQQDETFFALDLVTGKVTREPYRTAKHLGTRNSRGQRVFFGRSKGGESLLEIIDDQTGQVIASTKHVGVGLLVGDDYLVGGCLEGLIVERIVQRTTNGRTTIQLEKHICPIENPPSPIADGRGLQAIAGTNRFIYLCHDNTPPTIRVYEIDGGSIKEIARWTTVSKSAMVQHSGKLFTASQDGQSVEVRDLSGFNLLETRSLPSGLKSWEPDPLGISPLATRNDLFSFVDPKGFTRVHRIDDFSLIPELDASVTRGGVKSEQGDFRRYVMLTDGMFRQLSLTVYDSVNGRIVYQGTPPVGVEAMHIVDHYLVYVTAESGLTVEMHDLETGRLAQRYQPFAWIVWSVPVILCLALVWVVGWIRTSSRWAGHGWLSILIMAILFVTPLLIHAIEFNEPNVLRPSIGFSGCVVLVFLFGLALYVVYGSERFLLRSVPLWLYMAAVLGAVNLCVNQRGVRGLVALERLPAEPVVFLVIFPLVAVLVLTVLRVVGWLFRERDRMLGRRPIETPALGVDKPARQSIWLRDIFIVTASIAVFVAAAKPNTFYLVNVMPIVGVIALFCCMPMLLGIVGLSRSPTVSRAFSGLTLGWPCC